MLLKLEHIRLGHAGAQSVLSNLRMRYWPIGGLIEIKRIIRNCHTCFRFSAKTGQQIMSNLPKDRTNPSRPFSKVGVDFGGPYFVKTSPIRRSSLAKTYICVFVCMAAKAVHIELVSSLSTNSFILTLKRFISRRGNPVIIYSDNATNFIGSNNQLKEVYNFFAVDPRKSLYKTTYHLKEFLGNIFPLEAHTSADYGRQLSKVLSTICIESQEIQILRMRNFRQF